MTSSFNTSLPVLLVWSVDLKRIDLTRLHEGKIFVVWNIDSRAHFEEVVGPLFKCDTSPTVRLETEQKTTDSGCRCSFNHKENLNKRIFKRWEAADAGWFLGRT